MEKRGQLAYKALATIIGVAIIILGFIQAGKSYGSQEAYYKLAVAKDLALTIDLIYGLPGNIEFTYPNDISGYTIEIKDNLIKVYDGDFDKTMGIYTFAGTVKDTINTRIQNSQFVRLNKKGDKVIVTGIQK